jgi:hypothetical protein
VPGEAEAADLNSAFYGDRQRTIERTFAVRRGHGEGISTGRSEGRGGNRDQRGRKHGAKARHDRDIAREWLMHG